jgi:hypothetical protein
VRAISPGGPPTVEGVALRNGRESHGSGGGDSQSPGQRAKVNAALATLHALLY